MIFFFNFSWRISGEGTCSRSDYTQWLEGRTGRCAATNYQAIRSFTNKYLAWHCTYDRTHFQQAQAEIVKLICSFIKRNTNATTA